MRLPIAARNRLRDRPLVLDGEVGDAAPRIELEGRRKSGVGQMSRQARQEPQWSVSGASGVRSSGGEDRAEEQPGAEIARHQIGVLALPAQPGGLRQRLLHHRRRVDEHLDIGAMLLRSAAPDVSAALDQVVIIVALRVKGDGGAARAAAGSRGDRGRPIIDAEHDDAADLRPKSARIGAALRPIGKPAHVAIRTGIEETPGNVWQRRQWRRER